MKKSAAVIIWELLEVVVFLAGWLALALLAVCVSSLPKRR
jgi:hypothetical protein